VSLGIVPGLALRNLARNVRRTVITGVTVTFGVAVSVVGWGLVDGLDENALRAARTTYAGDLLLRPAGYPTDGMEWPLALARVPDDATAQALTAAGTWAPRVTASVRLVKEGDAVRALAVSWDPGRDGQVFPRDRWTLEGAWSGSDDADGSALVAGSGLARTAGLEVGDAVVLEARTRDGSLNALPFVVTGVVTTDNAALDNTSLWIRDADADSLLQLAGARTHLAVRLRDPDQAPALATRAKALGWDATTTREEVADLLALNDIRRRALVLLVGMVMAIAATGIANTVIMSVYERVREVGTLMAMGLRRAQVRQLFLLEGALMGAVSGIAGAALGAAVVLHFEQAGIHLGSKLAQAGGNAPISAVLYTRFSWPPLAGALAFGVGVSVLASLWPARHASNLHPADATRSE
jgi:putative ABC transport system permease protein